MQGSREASHLSYPSSQFLMSNSLFVGGISWNTTEQALSEYLSTVAPVLSVKIPTDKMSGKSRGFAFVEMQSAEDAQKVIAELNESELDGRYLRINIAREEDTEPCKLYVAGLADSVTDETLKQYLSEGGSVTGVSIVFDRDTGRSRGFAFVDTASEQDSEAIINACNGKMFEGKSILVRKSRPKTEKPRHSFNRNR
ncbi:hypothetical protein FJZ27_03340 [Candidatus Peribacteria bacterium]|nr:hypothetical protein [Candidatus Peribacteria bacterium]